jgi:hypothetical protein
VSRSVATIARSISNGWVISPVVDIGLFVVWPVDGVGVNAALNQMAEVIGLDARRAVHPLAMVRAWCKHDLLIHRAVNSDFAPFPQGPNDAIVNPHAFPPWRMVGENDIEAMDFRHLVMVAAK